MESQLDQYFLKLPDGGAAWDKVEAAVHAYPISPDSSAVLTSSPQNADRIAPRSPLATNHPVFWNVLMDTLRRQLDDSERKLKSAKINYLRTYGQTLRQDLDGLFNRSETATMVDGDDSKVFLRYVLEPLGIDVHDWSTSAFPQSYAIGLRMEKAIDLMIRHEELMENWRTKGQNCEVLASESRTLLASLEIPEVAPLPPVARPAFQSFEMLGCVGCHSDVHASSDHIRRFIPFDNEPKLSALLKSDQRLSGEILRRVSLNTRDPQYMPLNKLPVTEQEREQITRYLESIAHAP